MTRRAPAALVLVVAACGAEELDRAEWGIEALRVEAALLARHQARLRREEERIALLRLRLEEELPERASPQRVAEAVARCGGRPVAPRASGDADAEVTFRAPDARALAAVVDRLSREPAALRLERARCDASGCEGAVRQLARRPEPPRPRETAASWLPPRPPSWRLLAARRWERLRESALAVDQAREALGTLGRLKEVVARTQALVAQRDSARGASRLAGRALSDLADAQAPAFAVSVGEQEGRAAVRLELPGGPDPALWERLSTRGTVSRAGEAAAILGPPPPRLVFGVPLDPRPRP